MVMQKVSVRTRIESQNEERTKKIEHVERLHRALQRRYTDHPR